MAWRQQLAALRHRLAPLQNLGNLPTPLPDSGAAQTTRLVHSKDLRSDLASLLSCFMPPSAAAAAHSASADQQHSEHPQDRLYRQFGFKLDIRPSQIPHAGNGVYLCGHRPVPGSIVAMYPGTVYNPGEPTLLVSLANHYLLRCFDGLLVDGKARGLSGSVYRSLHSRHHPDPRVPSVGDRSWMDYARHGDSSLRNPLAIGQIINAASPTQVANARYQEVDIPPALDGDNADWPMDLRQMLPNLHADTTWDPLGESATRVVLIVTTRPVADGEELLTTYHERIQ